LTFWGTDGFTDFDRAISTLNGETFVVVLVAGRTRLSARAYPDIAVFHFGADRLSIHQGETVVWCPTGRANLS